MVNNLTTGNSSTFTVSFRRDSVRYLTIRGEAGERIHEKKCVALSGSQSHPNRTPQPNSYLKKTKNQAGIQLIGVMPKKETHF